MKTIAMLLLLISGRHPGEQARSYREAPEITRGRMILWQDPGAVERLDFRYGAGGRALEPRPPFTFLEEDKSGTSPKLTVRDANGRKWSVKFGGEAGADNFASRLIWAAGYVPEINYYFPEGVIQGVQNLRRTKRYVDATGRFQGARFQLRGGDRAFVDGVSWRWDDNPFVGTNELAGLKLLVMLLGNWDNKDLRDAKKIGSNTSIFREGNRYLFFVDDWGRSMGAADKWFCRRSNWNADDYDKQSLDFVRVARDGVLEFRFGGQHSTAVADVDAANVLWLMRYLGRVTDSQLHTGFVSSGATPEQAHTFTSGLRTRINLLAAIAERYESAQAKPQPGNPSGGPGGRGTAVSEVKPIAKSRK